MATPKPRTAAPRDRAFTALDGIENALVDAETTMALFAAMVDHDMESDTTCVIAIERHLAADVAALRAAFTKAHGDLFTGGAR